MSLLDIFLIAVSLSLDAVAVALTIGVLNGFKVKDMFKVGFFFGAFQAVMPLLGWLAGYSFKGVFEEYGHFIGFGLLLLVGLKMLYESFKKEEEGEEKNLLSNKVLTMLAVATSIDALVVGITFNFVSVNVAIAVVVIGLVTFVLSAFGVYLGAKSKDLVNVKLEIGGAIVLILLAFKILLF